MINHEDTMRFYVCFFLGGVSTQITLFQIIPYGHYIGDPMWVCHADNGNPGQMSLKVAPEVNHLRFADELCAKHHNSR